MPLPGRGIRGRRRRVARREARHEARRPAPPMEAAASRPVTDTHCEFARCDEEATYGFPDEAGIVRFCGAHKAADMIVVNPPDGGCEFPRCDGDAEFGFPDEPTVARFCPDHKSGDMILVHSERAEDIAMADVEDALDEVAKEDKNPEQTSLELAQQCLMLDPELEALDSAQERAVSGREAMKDLKGHIQHETDDIHVVSMNIEKLEARIKKQDWKPNLGGRSLFGKGVFMKDKTVVNKMVADKDENVEKLEDLEAKEKRDKSTLEQLKKEQPGLEEAEEASKALWLRMEELKMKIVEQEKSALLVSKRKASIFRDRLSVELSTTKKGLAQAHEMFKVALNLQAKAARTNAVARAGNMGQMIGQGDRGGRGVGNSPGERMLQLKRNRHTKKSVEQAQQACSVLEKTQHAISKDLRKLYPADMAKVGNAEVPKLWVGKFGQDMIVGAIAGDVGDAIANRRHAANIRRNMAELEKMVKACEEQMILLNKVGDHIFADMDKLTDEAHAEEDVIFARVKSLAAAEIPSAN